MGLSGRALSTHADRGRERIKRSCEAGPNLVLDNTPNEAAGPFSEGEFFGKNALEQYADAIVACHIGHRRQSRAFSDGKVNHLLGFGQDVQMPQLRGINLGQLSAGILYQHLFKLLKPFTFMWLHRLLDVPSSLADKLEDPIERAQDLISQKES